MACFGPLGYPGFNVLNPKGGDGITNLVVHGVLSFHPVCPLGGDMFGLGGAGHASIGVHPVVDIRLKVEDPPAFDELWPGAIAAHHGQCLVR